MSATYSNRPRSRSRDRMNGSLQSSRDSRDRRTNSRDHRARSRDRSRERRRSRSPRREPRRDSRDQREQRENRGTRNVLIDITSRVDPNLPAVDDDPRVKDNNKAVTIKGGGRNTESFDPASTLVRPDMRVIVGPKREVLNKKLKHDDILVVPEFFCDEDDYSIYYTLIEEMRKSQAEGVQNSEWISWHEGAHLISKNPTNSALFQSLLTKIATYFNIELKSVGTRFNWYRDSSDWKPFHHDSAAFNAQRARNQNITVGVSFGMTRELAFLNAHNGTKVYFPQTNGMLFSFGRDVNINWKHGINALPEDEQSGQGRISIVLWGMCKDVIEEKGSPPLLTDNTRGNGHSMHANSGACRDFKAGKCQYGDRCKFSHAR